jgi:hypothetical protein
MGVSMLQINLLGSAVSGALVVLFGAGCALLFAFSQLKKSKGMQDYHPPPLVYI